MEPFLKGPDHTFNEYLEDVPAPGAARKYHTQITIHNILHYYVKEKYFLIAISK